MIEQAVHMAQKAGMEDAVARLEQRQETQIKVHNSHISIVKKWNSRRLHLYMTADKKRLLLTLENPHSNAVKKAIASGTHIIPLLTPKDSYHGIGQPRTAPACGKQYDKAVVDIDQLIPIAEDAITRATENADSTAGILSAGTEHVELASSEGITAADDNSWATLSMRAFTSTGGSGHAVQCTRSLDGLNAHAGARATRDAVRSSSPRQGEHGTYDVVFSSLALANLLQHVAAFASAFYVDSGMSFLAGKMDDMVGSPQLTLKDSGIHPPGIATRSFDDEGIATGETTILDRGRLASYLHNTSTAHTYDTTTTANAGLIAPHPWNVVVSPGDSPLEDMIREVNHGLLVTNVWYTRFQNYHTGDFSTSPRDAAIQIKNGELGHAVTGIRISDSLPRLLTSITRLSRKQQQIHWWEVETPVFT
ncbi:MAG: TldD/PmbA family protein, partial [Thermoplasmatota archaeon]